jgi:hypothetical protein
LFGDDTGVISGGILFATRQLSPSPTMEEIVVSAMLVSSRDRHRVLHFADVHRRVGAGKGSRFAGDRR